MTIANFKPKEAQPITPQIWTDFLNHKNFDHVEQGEKAKLPVGPQAKKKNQTKPGEEITAATQATRTRPCRSYPSSLPPADPHFFSSDAS
jgi:hypothetical protein